MHTGILLAVTAQSAKEAVDKVNNWNEYSAGWSDWSEHGGRWSDELPNNVLCYGDNPELFKTTIAKYKQFTQDTIERDLEGIKDLTIEELVTNKRYSFANRYSAETNKLTKDEKQQALSDSLALFRAKKLLSIVHDDFTSEQHFYDIEDYTAETDDLNKRIESDPTQQYLVIWDYHH